MVDGVPSEKVSTLSFVDLAGTDRRHAKVSCCSCVQLWQIQFCSYIIVLVNHKFEQILSTFL